MRLFGPPLLQGPAGDLPWLPERRFRLLAVLAVAAARGERTTREQLAQLFWPERDTTAARANLRKLLLETRQLGIHGLEETPAGLRWQVHSDLADFEAAASAGDWDSAAALVRGPLLQGMDAGQASPAFEGWLRFERHAAHARWRDGTLRALAQPPVDGARVDSACARLLAAEPLDEDVLAAWLPLARNAGAPALAQAAYQRYVQQLAAELGLQPSERLRRLALPRPGPVLPAPLLTPIVGRLQEIDRASARLAQGVRLLTLLGPGGVGKTRLARHLAQCLAQRYTTQWFVPLEDLATPSALAGRIAEHVDPAIALGADAVSTLAARWPAGPSLLLLDGLEHLVDAAGFIESLLDRVPALQIVATSRERLECDGEWLLPLAGLGAPAAEAPREHVLAHDAVRLFSDHARRLQPRFDIERDWAAVRGICTITEGLPLALELAAAWVRVMPCADIERELASSTTLLAQGGRSLQTVFDHSWALLTPAERQAYARLSVFWGGFTREAAMHVADVPLPVLASLVDKSMLRVDAQGRFDRHALLHEAARAKLAAQPELAAQMQERHGRWCLAHLLRHHGVHGGGHAAKRAAIATERDNLLQAWQGWVDHRCLPELEAAAEVLSWFHVVEGRLPDAIALFDRAARALGADTPTSACLRCHQAWLELWMERHATAQAMARQALLVLQAHAHPGCTQLALRTLAHAARRLGRHGESSQLLGQALRLARQEADTAMRATLLDARAMALNMLGRPARAAALVRGAMALNDAAGNEAQRMYNEFNLSQALALAGQAAAALPWAEAALQRAQQIGYRFFEPYALCQRAAVRLALGRQAEAAADTAAALACSRSMGGSPALIWALELQGRLALADGRVAAARAALQAGAEHAAATGNLLMGAALLPVAAQAEAAAGDAARAADWLAALLACDTVQAPVRAEALSLGAVAQPARAGDLLALLRQVAQQRLQPLSPPA